MVLRKGEERLTLAIGAAQTFGKTQTSPERSVTTRGGRAARGPKPSGVNVGYAS